jgi:hypothetical protein
MVALLVDVDARPASGSMTTTALSTRGGGTKAPARAP